MSIAMHFEKISFPDSCSQICTVILTMGSFEINSSVSSSGANVRDWFIIERPRWEAVQLTIRGIENERFF